MRSNCYRSLTAMGLTLGLAVSAHAASLERELQSLLFKSEDAKEGIAAYNEKRMARFKNK